MRISFLLLLLIVFSGCSTQPEILPTDENKTITRISTNKSEALTAQEEYRRLQTKRN